MYGACRSWMQHRHDADREIAGNPAADLEETNPGCHYWRYTTPPGVIMYSMPVRTVCTFFTSPKYSGRHTCCRAWNPPSREPRSEIFSRRPRASRNPSDRSGITSCSFPIRGPDRRTHAGSTVPSPWSAATHSSSTAPSSRRIASISGMQVSVTRFMCRVEERHLVVGRSGHGSAAPARSSRVPPD